MNDLEGVIDYIEENITEDIGLKDIAAYAGYSPFYFSRSFVKTVGLPVSEYIRIRKLQHSVLDLLDGMKIIDIAIKYSFDSHEGYTRSFKGLFGSSPNIVKRNMKEYFLPEVSKNLCKRNLNVNEEVEKMDLNSGMHMLLFEVLKNCLEEAKEGFCSEIVVSFLEGNGVRISDDGRGIPVEKGEDILPKIFEGKLISKKEYLLADNLVLDEIKTVNALSERMKVTVYRNGKCYLQDYIKGIAQHPLIETPDAHKSGVVIEFTPDSDIFMNCRWNKEEISRWISENGVDALKTCKIIIND